MLVSNLKFSINLIVFRTNLPDISNIVLLSHNFFLNWAELQMGEIILPQRSRFAIGRPYTRIKIQEYR